MRAPAQPAPAPLISSENKTDTSMIDCLVNVIIAGAPPAHITPKKQIISIAPCMRSPREGLPNPASQHRAVSHRNATRTKLFYLSDQSI